MNKIILVANASWTMVKFRYGLMKELVKNNYDVYVISPVDQYLTEIENIGCKHIDIKMDNKGSNPINDLKLVYNLYSIYRRIKPDLIIHYTIKPNIYGSFAAKLSGCKSISIIPGLGYTFINENLTAKIAKILYKIALKIPKQVWFINEDDKNEFINRTLVSKDKVYIINSEGIDLEYFKSQKQNKKSRKFKFLVIARILKDKGIYEYIEAIKILQHKYNDIEYQLLGSLNAINPTSIQEKEVEHWVNNKIINYLGETKDVRPYIENVDCVILPSYREGKGMSLVEGAAMERPLIATNVPGCKDVVDDGVNGYLCKANNAQDLANKMKMMINLSDNERISMGIAGREKVAREFDEKIVINKYLESIKEILN